ncbi:hypothetical protein J2125_003225 [Erwinia toletana]|uniref:Uncharacterized protein n=1 Tax=Winslowiella toletana TaxID=92490 RepID=A0ABS4PBK2_9GAMM|nr:hypothetical protein [Winslowiella toletana]MBP2170033.1 hypothetical protein [Winslowiella toletana]
MAIIYIPALVKLLVSAQNQQSTPLSRSDVERIRANATAVSLPDHIAAEMTKNGSWPDINPDRCWEEWLAYCQFRRIGKDQRIGVR